MSAYLNGKNVNLNYVFNNNAYTNTVKGNAKIVLDDITEEQDITATVLMGDNVISETELHVYGTNPSEYKSYVTDNNGRAVVKGISPVTTIDALTEEYTVKAEYNKSIPEAFDNINDKIKKTSKAVIELQEDVIELQEDVNNNLAGALRGEALGKTAIALKDVSEVQHDVKVELSSNNIPLFPYEIEGNTIGGVPYTIQGDGTIVMSGYCNNDGFEAPLSQTTVVKKIVLPEGTYTFDWEESGNDVNNGVYEVYLKDVNEKWFVGTFTIDKETEFDLTIGTITQTGESYNITIKPMLSKGTKLSPPITEDTKIKVFGGNLFDTFSSDLLSTSTCVRQRDGSYRCNVKDYVYSEFKTLQMNDIMQSLDGQKITFSMSTEMPSDKYMLIIIYYTDGTSRQSKAVKGANSTSIVLNHRGRTIEKVGLRHMAQDEIRFTDTTTIFKDLQVEVGERSLYVPYQSPLEYKFGDNIKSIYPSMTMVSNTKGIAIDVVYNRDITKVVASQQAQIDELKAMMLNLTTN